MRLAIIDPHDNVLIAWPDVTSAHTVLADELAEHLHVRSKRQRTKAAAGIREFLLSKQQQSIRL